MGGDGLLGVRRKVMLEKQIHLHFMKQVSYVFYSILIEMKSQNMVAFVFVSFLPYFWTLQSLCRVGVGKQGAGVGRGWFQNGGDGRGGQGGSHSPFGFCSFVFGPLCFPFKG